MYVYYYVVQLQRPIAVLDIGENAYDAYDLMGFRTINFTRSDRCWMVPGTVDPLED